MTLTLRTWRAIALAIGAAAWAATSGCMAARPPVPVQEAIRTINRHLPTYVAEANRALAAGDHPEKERLVGTGERLVRAVQALERWAVETEPGKGGAEDGNGGGHPRGGDADGGRGKQEPAAPDDGDRDTHADGRPDAPAAAGPTGKRSP